MSELDETAVETAVRAGYASWMLSPWVGMESPEPFDDTEEGYQASWRCEIRAAIAAYLDAAAARPTPDAEAMEQTFLDAVNAHTTEVIMSTRRGVISSDAEIAAFHRVMNLYRKAVTS